MRGEILPRARHLAILEDDLVCMSPVTESSALFGLALCLVIVVIVFWLFFQIARRRKQAKIPQPKNSA